MMTQGTHSIRFQQAVSAEAGSAGRRARMELIGVVALLLITLAVSFLKGQDIYVFAYIMTVSVALGGPRRHGRPWSDIGIKGGFRADLSRVWCLAGLDALLFQVLPPTLVVAFVLGYGRDLLEHITSRLPVDISSAEGLAAVVSLLAIALVLTLLEELVYRVVIQERLSWFIGTPAAILVASVLFGLAHAVGASGSPQLILLDIAGVVLDGVFFGLIYARTHNLALTWATHYVADVVGVLAIVLVFRAM